MKFCLRVLALATLACLIGCAKPPAVDLVTSATPPPTPTLQVPSTPAIVAAKKPLTELDRERLVRIQTQLQMLNLQLQQSIQPLQIEQNVLIQKLCAGIGVPDGKMQTECKLDIAKADAAEFGIVRWEKPSAPQVEQPAK